MTRLPRVVSMASLRETIIRCRRCPRLVRFRENVQPRPAFLGQDYWRKPVPGFGDTNGRLLILGIAPALHGGNRTGRPFTGDNSGRFLVKALYKTGFANKPVSESRDDGLVYNDCFLTAAVKCVPPADKPTAQEFRNCSTYLDAEIALLGNLKSVLVLGSLSFDAFLDHLKRKGINVGRIRFRHGTTFGVAGLSLHASYHPSPRNTNTGRLTEAMLVSVLENIKKELT